MEDTRDPPHPTTLGAGGPVSEEVARDLAEETAIEQWLRRDRALSPPPDVDVSTSELLTALLSRPEPRRSREPREPRASSPDTDEPC